MSKLSELLEKITKAKISKSSVRAYMKNFDQAKEITKKMQSQDGELELKDYNLTIEKQEAIEEIITGLLSKEMLDLNLQIPLRKILYRSATTGIPILEAENELRKFIINQNNKAGFAERYVKDLAQEALARYDGDIEQRIANEFGLNCFRIVGALNNDSLQQCIEMVEVKGDLGRFAVNGKYAVEDLPEIIKLLKKNYIGVDYKLNESNFAVLRLHKNCNHQILYSTLLEEDKAILRQRKGN